MALAISVLEVSRDLESESKCVPRVISFTLDILWETKGFRPSLLVISIFFSLSGLCLMTKEVTVSSRNRSPDEDALHAVPVMKDISSYQTLEKTCVFSKHKLLRGDGPC